MRLILGLQVSGFAAAAALLIVLGRGALRPGAIWFLFLASFAVHLAGDVLFIAKEGLPVPFKLSNLEQFVKLPAFLVFVGLAIAAVCLYLVDAHGFAAHIAKGFAVVGLFMALAGFVYDKIYP